MCFDETRITLCAIRLPQAERPTEGSELADEEESRWESRRSEPAADQICALTMFVAEMLRCGRQAGWVMLRQCSLMLAPLICAALLGGCRESADSFFSGRPSGMAMAHNRVLDGSVESMVELLRIPGRFPGANESQRANWQESVIAWWLSANGRGLLLAALPKLTPQELQPLQSWVAVRDKSRTPQKAAALDEIGDAIRAIGSPGGRSG